MELFNLFTEFGFLVLGSSIEPKFNYSISFLILGHFWWCYQNEMHWRCIAKIWKMVKNCGVKRCYNQLAKFALDKFPKNEIGLAHHYSHCIIKPQPSTSACLNGQIFLYIWPWNGYSQHWNIYIIKVILWYFFMSETSEII